MYFLSDYHKSIKLPPDVRAMVVCVEALWGSSAIVDTSDLGVLTDQ